MLKRTYKLAMSLLSSWLIAMVWTLMLTTLLGYLYNYVAARVIVAVLIIFTYLALSYSTAWRQGFKDQNMVNTGHLEKEMNLGLYAGLMASVPTFIVVVFYYLTRYLITDWYAITNVVARIWNVIYLQVLADTLEQFPASMALVLIPMPVAAALGYVLGYHDYSIWSKIVYVNKKAPQKHG